MNSRLYDCLRLLKWQGGTIHQVNDFCRAIDSATYGKNFHVISLTIEEWNKFITKDFPRLIELNNNFKDN